VRGPKALDLLERGLRVKEFELDRNNFSATGVCRCCKWSASFPRLQDVQHGKCSRPFAPHVLCVLRRQLRLRH
jgi:hypothetical protein